MKRPIHSSVSRIVQLGRTTAAARIHGEAEAGEVVQRRASPSAMRRNHRELALGELDHECVLFEDLRVGPARGAIELRDDRRTFLHPHLVYAVLVAVQREQAPVAAQPDALQRVEHAIGGEAGVGGGGISILHPRILTNGGLPAGAAGR